MHRLIPVVFNDDWGSHVSIASVTGRRIPTEQPESELWMGAHEAGPAGLVDGPHATLLDLVAADPSGTLGELADEFGGRLPFLLKVLAPGKAISIQVHPTQEQAVEQRQLSGDAVYVDDWAKPELLLALAPFEVFVGLREFEESVALIDRLALADLIGLAAEARHAGDPVHALLTAILSTPPGEVADLARRVVASCVRVSATDDEFGEATAAIVGIAEDHPDDIGLAVLLLMHHRVLHPGEFIDVAAGVLHSYVRGLGIEVLANSDNVVRAGLTAKPVNVPELLRIVDTSADGVAGRPRRLSDGVEIFDSASDRFRLFRVDASADPIALPGGGPRIAFCLRGRVELVGTTGEVAVLGDAESLFLPASTAAITATGDGELYVVATPAD